MDVAPLSQDLWVRGGLLGFQLPWLAPHAADPTGKIGRKIRPEIRQNPIFPIFEDFGPFWPIFDVLEARDLFKKLPGGDTLRFHRV